MLASISETIRLKTVTVELTSIMDKAAVDIYIDQLRIKHGAVVANTENDFILGMDLISRHGLTVELVEKVLRHGNESVFC